MTANISAKINFRNIIPQFFLIFCLFFAFTGGAFLISWEQLKHFRDFHWILSIVFVVVGGTLSYYQYIKNKNTFFSLEPVRSIKRFFEMPPVISVGILTAFYFTTQLTYQIVMHAGLETALWDFGFYDQIIWNTSHGNFLITSVRGGLHVFAEHFKPIFVLLAPVYWVGNSTVLLLTIFTLINSSTVALTYLIAKTVTRSHAASLILTLCVFFYGPLRNTINFLVHTQALADPFILFGFFFVLRRQTGRALLFFCLALTCKENIAMDVLGVGLFLLSKKEKTGWVITFLALLFLVLFVFMIEPGFRYPYHFVKKWDFYSHFVNPTPELWKRVLAPNPLYFLLLVFGPFFFLSFKCKGWFWLLGPSLALRLLSAMPGFRLTTAHYTGGLNALVITSVVYGLASFINTSAREEKSNFFDRIKFFKNQNIILVLLIFSAFLFSGKPELFTIDKYLWEASKPDYQRIVRILESVPARYSVLTNERPSAHLSHRSNLYVFFSMFPHAPLEEAAKHPDLIIEDTERIQDPERKALAEFVKGGYRLIFEYSFIKIYASPSQANAVPPELIAQWERFKQMPVNSYRRIVQFWYRWILATGLLFLFAFLLVRKRSQVA